MCTKESDSATEYAIMQIAGTRTNIERMIREAKEEADADEWEAIAEAKIRAWFDHATDDERDAIIDRVFGRCRPVAAALLPKDEIEAARARVAAKRAARIAKLAQG